MPGARARTPFFFQRSLVESYVAWMLRPAASAWMDAAGADRPPARRVGGARGEVGPGAGEGPPEDFEDEGFPQAVVADEEVEARAERDVEDRRRPDAGGDETGDRAAANG
jgi:hypothetical protein